MASGTGVGTGGLNPPVNSTPPVAAFTGGVSGIRVRGWTFWDVGWMWMFAIVGVVALL